MRNALRYVAVRWRITDQPVLCAEKMRTHRAALPEKEVWTMTDLKCSVETCCFHDGDCCCRNDIMVGSAKGLASGFLRRILNSRRRAAQETQTDILTG